jgi:hypothetical protein
MKIRLALAILMGTVALGMGQTTAPTLEAIAETPTTITVLVTAGSEPISGFDIYWKGARTRWQVSHFFVGLNCPRSYALEPFQNIAVIIGIETTGDFCRTDSWLHGLNNCSQYLMYVVPHHGGAPTNITIGETTGCGP